MPVAEAIEVGAGDRKIPRVSKSTCPHVLALEEQNLEAFPAVGVQRGDPFVHVLVDVESVDDRLGVVIM